MATTGIVPRAPLAATQVTLYTSASALGAGTVNSGSLTGIEAYSSAEFTVAATISGTTTLNVYIQKLLPNGDWDDIVSFTQLSATGKKTIYFSPQIPTADHSPATGSLTAGSMLKTNLGDTIRVSGVVAGASPNAQFTVTASFYQ